MHYSRRTCCKEVIDIDAAQGNYITRQNLGGKAKPVSDGFLSKEDCLVMRQIDLWISERRMQYCSPSEAKVVLVWSLSFPQTRAEELPQDRRWPCAQATRDLGEVGACKEQ